MQWLLACVAGLVAGLWGPKKRVGCESEVVVVTGSSGGLGKAIKAQLEAEGFEVVGASRSEGIDLRSAESMRALKEKVASKHLVGLVNNAGTYSGEGYGNRDYVGELISGRVYEDYVADEAVNVRAMINVTGTLVPDLLEGAKACGSATILNVGSINGVLSFEDSLPYGATKGAVEMWTDALRRTLAGRGIRVTALQPGLMRTNMCPDAYCEPPEKTCVPAVVRALTLSEPRSRYTCAMRTKSSGVFFDWPELFWIQKHLPTWLADKLMPRGMMIDCDDNNGKTKNSKFC